VQSTSVSECCDSLYSPQWPSMAPAFRGVHLRALKLALLIIQERAGSIREWLSRIP
jgi:hypothetical protein